MRKGLAVAVIGLLGCSPTGPSAAEEAPAVAPTQPASEEVVVPDAEPAPDPEVAADPVAEASAEGITAQMTSATLADDCGSAPTAAPGKPKKAKSKLKQDRARKAKRRCEQSSIQLAVVAAEGSSSASISVKSVEVLLESGASIGTLNARAPSVWSDDDGYAPWDQKIEAGQDLSVSYALSQPDWSQVKDRRSQTYTVKAVLSIAGEDRTVEHDAVVQAPTSLPPGVKT